MKYTRLKKLVIYPCVVSLCLLGCTSLSQPKDVTLVPQPVSVEKGQGTFVFGPHTLIVIDDESQRTVAEYFADIFTKPAGFTPEVKTSGEGNLYLQTEKSMKPEAYEMQITSDKITIKASESRGFFYALQSIRLMLPPVIESQDKADASWEVPVQTIKDEPRFAYRGYMLDVSRYFLPKEEVLKMIDCISMLKINTLHLHLSDDNGWRLEIKKYPKLTEVGAWRVDRQNLPFSDRRNPQEGESTPIGGFYTQEDMKEIIRYAAERQIEIIPEIDVPAHSNAALAAYPEYACPVVKRFIGVLPGLGGRNSEIIFCAGNDRTYEFLQGVLDEVMALFPSRYMHLGGDEATKTYWKKCPLCQSRIRKEHLADEEALQGYFMERLASYVRSKGKIVMGWDELTNSTVPKEAVIFGWQGFGQAALKAAEQGHRFVMTPARIAYLIRYQGPQWFEPVTYFGNNTLTGLFDYEPVQPDWKPEYEKLLMGVQASMWTEFCNKPEDVFYLTFPRVVALAEIAWAQKGTKDWEVFQKGLDNYLEHLSQKGIVYARSMYNIQHKVTPTQDGLLDIDLTCERTDVEIRYTLDGTEPLSSSELYTEQGLQVSQPTVVKAATFAGDKQMGQTLTLPIQWNLATAKRISDDDLNKGKGVLINGVRGSLKQSDFEWYTGDLNKPLSVTVDLLKPEAIRKCSIGCITNYGMGVHKPRTMSVEISQDGTNFKEVGKLDFSDEEIFKEGNFIENLSVEIPETVGQYVRFTLVPPGICPESHVRPGQVSKVYVDEIVIE